LIYDDSDHIPPDALLMFGKVSVSFFSLFELMNGDTSVIEPIKDRVIGRLLFAGFMVIANWAILAILTAVVSDQMIAASEDYEAEEKKARDTAEESKSLGRLLHIFEDNDDDKNGLISKEEWEGMLEDPGTMLELSDGTHLAKSDLLDLFDCLAVEGEGNDGKVMYNDLIHSLKTNSSLADKRAILHIMVRLRIFQNQVTAQVEDGFENMKAAFMTMDKGQNTLQFPSTLAAAKAKLQTLPDLGSAVMPSGTRSSPPERVKASL